MEPKWLELENRVERVHDSAKVRYAYRCKKLRGTDKELQISIGA
jgi:hypothetical protein